jgi:hypothetical protein
MRRVSLCAAVLLLGSVSVTAAGSSPFNKMSVGTDQPATCEAPRPPVDLNPSAYIRNGYRAILQTMAAERWQETGDCQCFLSQITWEEALLEAPGYVTSDNPLVPFKVADLRIHADQLMSARNAACAN